MTRRRRRTRKANWGKRLTLALLAIPALYLLAALVGSLVPVNRSWAEPPQGTTVFLISNGVHTDLILPAEAQGLDWRLLLPRADFAAPDPRARWIAFGMGERRVYLETPRWRDIRAGTIWAALTGGERVMHVEWVSDPAWHARAIRLRPEEYRRLWSGIRAGFALDANGRARRIDHPGYGRDDAFYKGVGRASAVNTCNVWAADRLRLAGIRTSLWSPFAQGLEWRYSKA
ncbi:MAG: TIGR02117 family protein [Sphingomicrobium sp.]|nr:TIGR02117 family protein [Sphingomonadales bacterium]